MFNSKPAVKAAAENGLFAMLSKAVGKRLN